MLTVKTFIVNPVQENCYVVSDSTREAVIIDCGCFFEKEWQAIRDYIKQNELKPVQLLCTHAHFDHVMGNQFVMKDFKILPRMSRTDHSLYEDLRAQTEMFMGKMFADSLDTTFTRKLGATLQEDDTIDFGNHHFRVITTPGHTRGGLSFYCQEEQVLFSGDTLFHGSVGRTDLPGGDFRTLILSVTQRLLQLPADTRVCCGHGPETSIDYELNFNPYV